MYIIKFQINNTLQRTTGPILITSSVTKTELKYILRFQIHKGVKVWIAEKNVFNRQVSKFRVYKIGNRDIKKKEFKLIS